MNIRSCMSVFLWASSTPAQALWWHNSVFLVQYPCDDKCKPANVILKRRSMFVLHLFFLLRCPFIISSQPVLKLWLPPSLEPGVSLRDVHQQQSSCWSLFMLNSLLFFSHARSVTLRKAEWICVSVHFNLTSQHLLDGLPWNSVQYQSVF